MIVFNPFTGNLDFTGTSSGGGGGPATIPEVSSDPGSPSPQDAWVLKTTSGGSGNGQLKFYTGLGVPITGPATSGSTTYQFSYFTNESTIIRVPLT